MKDHESSIRIDENLMQVLRDHDASAVGQASSPARTATRLGSNVMNPMMAPGFSGRVVWAQVVECDIQVLANGMFHAMYDLIF